MVKRLDEMVKVVYYLRMLTKIAEDVWAATDGLRMPLGVRFPVRMTVLRSEGQVVLISPVAVDDALAAEIDALGAVTAIVAPNLLHHLFLAAAAARWPDAKLYGPRGLASGKRKELAFDGTPDALGVPGIDVVPLAGVPSIDEHVVVHRASRTLVVTDLVFNVREGNWMTRFVLTWVSDAFGAPKTSRLWRMATRDQGAFAESLRRVLAHDFDRMIVAHGEIVETDAKAVLVGLSGWLGKTPALLPSAT